MSIAYVVPVHNSETHLRNTVEQLCQRLATEPGSQIILVENGSSDSSPELVKALAASHSNHAVCVVAAVSPKGMGNAYRRGLELVDADLIVLTASDLPFRFTDLDAYLAQTEPHPQLAIGSKAHPDSQISVNAVRRLLSGGFRLLRTLLLGIRTADTQGTLLIQRDLAAAIRPHLLCTDYLISTEIVAWAKRLGVTAVELPVVYERAESSTVSPIADSLRMAAGLVTLARRIDASATENVDTSVDPWVQRMVGRENSSGATRVVLGVVIVVAAGVGLMLAVLVPLSLVALIGRELNRYLPSFAAHPQRGALLGWVALVVLAAVGVLGWRARRRA